MLKFYNVNQKNGFFGMGLQLLCDNLNMCVLLQLIVSQTFERVSTIFRKHVRRENFAGRTLSIYLKLSGLFKHGVFPFGRVRKRI